jgi:hypothetical protein
MERGGRLRHVAAAAVAAASASASALCRIVNFTSVNTTWRNAGLIHDFMECAEHTPTFLIDTNITPIQNNEMQAASSFTFSPVQLYSTCN